MEGQQLEKTHMRLYRIETESLVDMNKCQKSSIICEEKVVQVVGRDCRWFMYVLADSKLKFSYYKGLIDEFGNFVSKVSSLIIYVLEKCRMNNELIKTQQFRALFFFFFGYPSPKSRRAIITKEEMSVIQCIQFIQ